MSDERYYAMLERGQYEILDTWHVAGLRGSGSHDVRVSGVQIPENRLVATLGMGSAASKQLRDTFGRTIDVQ